ncbi:hypothetical protein [uncultured Hyphomicrobium sp.]|uniref:hypothetical protein n=1 Tax=uncultured Hyphomicrobium sp. TaxID=194373 RepID=UPI0025FEA091|nr:hypothetical protein [uncultured Hyphomicrobium sp.]
MLRVCSVAIVVAACLVAPLSAAAYGPRVKKFCANDYMDNCHLHRLGTPELRACMRKAGAKLSPECVNALIAEGEVSAAEVAQRRAAAAAAGK